MPDPAPPSEAPSDALPEEFVDLGRWPRLHAQILRARLESVGLSVFARWDGPGADAIGVLAVPAADAQFGRAVVTELEVDDEVSDTSPHAYLSRIDEHLSALAGLVDELRTRLDDDSTRTQT